MIIYSKSLEAFRKRLKLRIKEILAQECRGLGIQVRQKRFLFKNYYFPIEVILFEKENLLGYFDSKYYTIGIHRNLILLGDQDQNLLDNILRHEIGHYLCFILYGKSIKDHGPEYRQLCQQCHWNESVYSAKLKVEQDYLSSNIQKNHAILDKVKKLLALAESQNENESRMATLKANELIQKHQLEHTRKSLGPECEEDEENEMVCQTVWVGTRNNNKMLCISEILGEFFVYPYFNYGKGEVRLEIMGRKEQVLTADYLCKYYQNEFERLWKLETSLKGMRQKNSFFRGLTQGHLNHMRAKQKSSHAHQALIQIKADLQTQVRRYLPQVQGRAHDYQSDRQAQLKGQATGASLEIRKGLEQGLQKIKRLGMF